MFVDMLANVLMTAFGAGILISVVMRAIPNERMYNVCKGAGRAMTGWGRAKFGRAFWEKIEDFIENSIMVCWNGLRDGWNADDDPVEQAVKNNSRDRSNLE